MNFRNLAVTATATAAFVGLGATSAFAQDCFVVNRSDQGSTAVGHSQAWISIPVADIVGVSGQCAIDVNDALTAAGLPTVLATMSNKTLLGGTAADANGKTADGKGVDHFEDSPIVGQTFGVVGNVLSTDAACF
ncbi:MAG TPA: hypothetical protein VFJ17_06320 [Mycobacteriales bacterium]|jgi:hypothetical protein|nr:hypothetical protein [Mycobacteriales bacterium]